MRYRAFFTGSIFFIIEWMYDAKPPLKLSPEVNLKQFMGSWFVIASYPNLSLKKAHLMLIESYQLNEDGTIATTFTFNEGSLSGPIKTYHPKGICC
jgi:apolipoprotein D and lipocalin family protein